MEKENIQKIVEASYYPRTFLALGMLALFLFLASVNELRSGAYIGTGIAPTDTITVSGEGEVFAIPDTATFTFTVDETGTDVASAQAKATTKANSALAYLKAQGIADVDIQTTGYNVNPQYEYSAQVCAQNGYCPPQKQTISGYEVSQTVSVKVRDTTKAGTILSGIGSQGVSDVSGLSFTVADEQSLENQARNKAITQARTNADTLAKSLGVSIVRVVGYNENQSGGVVPMYAMKTTASSDAVAAPAPEIPTGQNDITANVSVTYEIR